MLGQFQHLPFASGSFRDAGPSPQPQFLKHRTVASFQGVKDSRAGERLPDIPTAITALVTLPFVVPVKKTRTALVGGARFTHSHPRGWLERGSLLPAEPREAEDDDSKISKPTGTDPQAGAGPAGSRGAHCPLRARGIKGRRRQLPAAAPGRGETSPGTARATLSG